MKIWIEIDITIVSTPKKNTLEKKHFKKFYTKMKFSIVISLSLAKTYKITIEKFQTIYGMIFSSEENFIYIRN